MNNNIIKKKYFRSKIRTRHPTHNILRYKLPLFPFKSIIRLGSTTELVNKGSKRVEINTVQAIKNSANKLLMKQCFSEYNVKTPEWWVFNPNENIFNSFNGDGISINDLYYPIVCKHIYGSRGKGNTLINSKEELIIWKKNKNLSNYIFEKFYNYNKEYRLHITEDGCFYTCRKMLKENTIKEKRWFRNDSNSVWIIEDNILFDKPINWDNIVKDCVKALISTKLDFAAFDVRVQSKLDKNNNIRENPEWIVIESNSAPSFGKLTAESYLITLPKILIKKWNLISSV